MPCAMPSPNLFKLPTTPDRAPGQPLEALSWPITTATAYTSFRRGSDIVSACDENQKKEFSGRQCAIGMTMDFCKWIDEAWALSANGMPENSSSLVRDGDCAPDLSAEESLEKSSHVFDIIKEDAAWQVAQTQWVPRPVIGTRANRQRKCAAVYMSAATAAGCQRDIIEGQVFH
ncbi:MAG: hypothetical protein Q9219_006816 [cf. Caloplaca sp. 3 TL-2023]